MKPNKNDIVKLFFKNGLQVEGRVETWSKEIVLSSEDSKNYLVITRPKEVIMYKVIKQELSDPVPTSVNQNLFHPVEIYETNNAEDHLSVDNNLDSSELKIKSLAELRKFQLEEEKKAIANKLKQHHIGEVRKVEYTSHDQIPGFHKK